MVAHRSGALEMRRRKQVINDYSQNLSNMKNERSWAKCSVPQTGLFHTYKLFKNPAKYLMAIILKMIIVRRICTSFQ
jgi:hypothetical protein